jgi:nitroreductase
MTHAAHDRRRFLIRALSGSAALAFGGAAAYAANDRSHGSYDDAVASTWRHSPSMDLRPKQVQRELVRYATLAANSHNTQPWHFALADHSILATPDFSRRLHAVDPDDHHLFASLGCAIENLVQAASAFGIQASPQFESETGGVRVELAPASPRRTGFFESIPDRQSTRADYDGRVVPAEQLRMLEAAGNGESVRMLLVTERKEREAILSYLIAGNSAQMDDEAFVGELKSWIRFSYRDALSTRDGLFSKASGNLVIPGWLGSLIFNRVFTKEGENKKYVSQIRSSSGVAVFVSERNEPEQWVEAGRCCQRFALQATALGLCHSFVNQPVEVPRVRGQFASYLGVGDRRPDLVMRFGYGLRLPRSLRRSVNEVVVAG